MRKILAAVVLAMLIAGCARPVLKPTGVPGMKSLGTNSQGFDECQWLKDKSVMIRIPAGTFTMGADDGNKEERPARRVSLSGFWIDKYEVTNRQYRAFCNATGHTYPPDPHLPGLSSYFTNYPDYPVVNVSRDDAVAYCWWTGKRLPTEAEWEMAARGTDGRKYPWGEADPDSTLANYNPHNNNLGKTAPVGSCSAGASPYGCSNMLGNVWEWCEDWYAEDYYTLNENSDPQGPSNSYGLSSRVVRGCDFGTTPDRLRVTRRFGLGHTDSDVGLGFRCAMSGKE